MDSSGWTEKESCVFVSVSGQLNHNSHYSSLHINSLNHLRIETVAFTECGFHAYYTKPEEEEATKEKQDPITIVQDFLQ